MVYLDSSALVKLVVREEESTALRRRLRSESRAVSCGLARTEVPRAVRHAGPAAMRRAVSLLDRIDLVRLDDSLLDAAGRLDPGIVSSLDAIHLAAAERIGRSLESIVTYDRRMAEAAANLGFLVEAPR